MRHDAHISSGSDPGCPAGVRPRDAAPGPPLRDAAPLLTVAGRDFPTNRGGLCRKGWTSASLLDHPGRVTEPLLKGADGVHRPVSWDEALTRIVAAVKQARAGHGADAVGVFGGGGLTNEKAYQLGKFARLALGTSRIDYNGRFCMSSAAAAGMRAFGLDRGLPFPLADLDAASTILMLGSNVAETMPPFVQHLQGARDAGGLIVVDPRRSATAAFTSDGGGLHLQPLPGTDLALLLGISHAVIHEGLADAEYIADRTTGYDAVVRSVGRLLAGAGPVDHRRPRRADPRNRPAAGRRRPQGRQLHPHRPRRRTARRRHRHRHGRHQPLASCWACRAPRAAATARSPGRATARAAANTARRRTSSPATGRSPTPPPAPTWPRSGACPKP